MPNMRPWLIAIGSVGVLVALWSALQRAQPATERAEPAEHAEHAETEAELPPPAAELAPEPASAEPKIAPEATGPSTPSAEPPQPSAAEAPTTMDPAASAVFVNTPRKRSAEAMRLHFANTPQTPTPGIGLSKAACAELREREQRADALSDRELLHLRIDCRGR